MLVTLQQVKDNLGITVNTYDQFLTDQINLISEAMELYCGRKFKKANYTQTFYRDEFNKDLVNEIYLHHYPVNSITSIVDANGDAITDYRLVPATGLIRSRERFFANYDFFRSIEGEMTVQYNAGYANLPYTLQSVIYSLVGERYNKKVAGVDLNFGTDVQRISIPGTISIDYDYTLQNNDSTTALGSILGSQINILDQFKSERKVIGTLREGYVY